MKRLVFTGDVMIARMVNDYLRTTKKYVSIWGNTIDVLKSADLTFTNLECALTQKKTRGIKENPVFFFRSEPENVKTLAEAGVDYCSLANNHILDFGPQGLLDTIKVLSESKISFAGAGQSVQEAQKPAQLEVKGFTISAFSITDNEEGWEASSSKPGTYYLPINLSSKKVKEFLDKIEKEKDKGNFVIVSAHWGYNMVRVPLGHHRDFAHVLVDAGCDIFHGHSAHVFQAVEIYKGKVIFYDCGEMIDDYAVEPILRNDESFIFEVYLEEEKIRKVILKPILIDYMKVNVQKGKHAEIICSKMIDLCDEFQTPVAFKNDVLEIVI